MKLQYGHYLLRFLGDQYDVLRPLGKHEVHLDYTLSSSVRQNSLTRTYIPATPSH